jgi:uncharacterized protein
VHRIEPRTLAGSRNAPGSGEMWRGRFSGLAARTALTLLAVTAFAAAPAQGTSEVADAVMRNDASELEALLREGADVNAAQPDGATALHWAAHRDDVEAVRRLLQAGADATAASRAGVTPLSLASEAGSAQMIRLLLEAGADANERFRNGETALMMAARTGNAAALDVLLEHGAQVDARESLRGTTALMWAAAYSNPEAVRRLLGHGADFSLRSDPIQRGRRPYLAPPARERIEEFERGTGLRGAAVDFSLDDDPEFDLTGSSSGSAAADEDGAVDPAVAEGVVASDDDEAAVFNRPPERDWGGLTALIFAAREGDLEAAKILLDAGADVNQTSEYGWTALLTATQNRYYQLGKYLLERGADPNIANKGGWNPLYIATDNRNIEGGDYPTRRPDMDHLEYIELLLAAGADPNLRMKSSTETRTIFTHQWLFEEGATPFLRAAQSGDLTLMKRLLELGADPSIATEHDVTPLMVAAGVGWVEGVTYEWSPEQTLETVKFLIELGADVNAQDTLDGRTALMGAAHKGRSDVVQLLVDHGADLAARDIGSRDSIHVLAGVTWQAIDYADGLVRVGVQSAIPHPETAALLRKLMIEAGLPTPPAGRTLDSICVTDLCR